ncbi:MAG: ERCC4 domain-containing protein [Lentisphaeria bacterium]
MARDDIAGGPPVRVVMDDRERGCAAALALAALPGVTCECRRLDLGDYQIDGQLLVERKTLTDLVASIKDGRLFRQAYALATHEVRPLLILEGTAAEIADDGMRREAIQGALITVTVVWGVPVLRALDGAESARLMLYAARQMRRAATERVFRPGRRPRGRKRAQLRILLGLPGIGTKRAERLLEQFGSVEAVMTAGAAALTAVAGIGRDTAAGIRWAVGAAAEENGQARGPGEGQARGPAPTAMAATGRVLA